MHELEYKSHFKITTTLNNVNVRVAHLKYILAEQGVNNVRQNARTYDDRTNLTIKTRIPTLTRHSSLSSQIQHTDYERGRSKLRMQ